MQPQRQSAGAEPSPNVPGDEAGARTFDARQPQAGYVASSRSPFLSTLSPGPGQRRAGLAVVLVSLSFFLGAAPFASRPLAAWPAFLPIYQSALVVIDLITATLLLGQYAILRSRSLLVLAGGYVFSACLAVAHALSFPGLFTAGGLLGGGQATAWLYFLWHAGFPLFILAYALLKRREAERPSPRRPLGGEIASCAALTFGAAALAVVLAATPGLLPPLMAGDSDAPAKVVVATATWGVGLLTLVLLWLRRPHSVIDLWLMVVLCVWAADLALAAVFNNARFDVGWYAGRIFGLLASSFVLAVLLLENSMLYARLAEANEAQRRRAAQLLRLSTELEAANRDLDAFAGGLAHDLQQPITTIGAFAQVIQQQSGHLIGAGENSHLQRIIQAAGHAQRMIRSLLEFARLGQKSPEKAPVDLNRLVEEVRAGLPPAAGRVAWEVARLPVVQADAALLQLALANLLSNAVKYSAVRERPCIRIDASGQPGQAIRVRITDNGVGFDSAQAARLFRPFERLHEGTAFEGTGMGLVNVRRIMDRHGGAVEAQAVEGEGASFTLVFPAPGAPAGSTLA